MGRGWGGSRESKRVTELWGMTGSGFKTYERGRVRGSLRCVVVICSREGKRVTEVWGCNLLLVEGLEWFGDLWGERVPHRYGILSC